MLAANQLDLGAEVRDGARPHRGEAHRDRVLELPRGPLRPRVRAAPGRRDAGAQRLHRLRPGPDHPGPVRHPRHGPRGLAGRGAVGAAAADRESWTSPATAGRARAHPGVVRARVASPLRLGLPARPAAWPGAAPILCPPMGEEGRAAHRTLPAARRGARGGRDRRPALRLRRHRRLGGAAGRPRPGAELARQHRGGPAVPPRPRRPDASPPSACGSAPPWPPSRPRPPTPFTLAGLLGPVPERPHLPARGRGALRLRGDRRRGARRRAAAHPGLPVRRATRPRRCARSTSASSRPTGRSPTGCCC